MPLRKLTSLFAVLAMAVTAQAVRADMISGTDSFYAGGKITSDTGDINTATTYTIKGFSESAGNGTGDFDPKVDAKGQSFGTVTLDLTFTSSTGGTTDFTFGNAKYGTFTATSFIVISSSDNSMGQKTEGYYLLGSFTPGTLFKNKQTGVSNPASLVLSFSQNGSSNPSLSGTLSVPPAAVPEPASMTLLGLGAFAAIGMLRGRRKS